MSPTDRILTKLRGEQGYTLIELLVTMIIGLVVSFAAFSILQFTTDDVSRITSRAHVDQTGRVALEKILLQLHSVCVAPTVTPILPKSNEKTIRFISEISPLNANKEPVSSLATVRLHKIIYTPAGSGKAGTLTEESWPSSGTSPNYTFVEKPETATKQLLLTGVKQTENDKKEVTPIFRYYRYYREGDAGAKFGQIDPATVTNLETEEQAEEIAKVTVSFTLAPEGYESIIAKGGQPVAMEDSAIFRLAPSSEASSSPNLPCTQQT